MKKRLLQIMGIFLCLQSFYMTAGAEEIPIEEPEVEIIDTIPIEPDVVTLLKEEVRYTQHWDEGCYDDTIQLTQSDAWLMMQIASAEALNQGKEGLVKVMTVIWNRVKSEQYPNSVYGVVSQSGQFTTFSNGSYLTAEITPEVHEALAEIEKNRGLDESIIAFENGNSLNRYFDVCYKLQDHTFYKLKSD